MSVSVFAERLRNAMNSRGLKQVDLVHAAEHRGVKMGKSHISQYVAGNTMPREDVLEFLASELDVDMNWLRGEESTTQLNSDASNSVTDGEHAATPLATGASKPQTDSEIPVGRRRTFGKSHKLDNVLYDVRGPVADEATRMDGPTAPTSSSSTSATPRHFGFRTPDEVVNDMSPPAHRLPRATPPSRGPVHRAQGHHASTTQLKGIPNVHRRRHLHRQRRQPSSSTSSMSGATRRPATKCFGALARTTRCGPPARTLAGGHRRPLPLRRAVRTGTPTSTTSAPRSLRDTKAHRHHQPEQPHRRTLPTRKCSSRSSTSRANTSSSSSPTKSTIASSWTACSTSPSPRWPRTCSA